MRAPARAAQFEYKCAHDLGEGDPLNVRSVQMWNAVTHDTGGRFAIQNFPAGALGSDAALLTQLRTGAIQFALIGAAIAQVVPVMGISNLGYAFPTVAAGFAAMDGPLGAYVRGDMAAAGIIAMPRMWANGVRQVTTGAKAIRTADDMQGLKIRIAPSKIIVDLFRALGASPTPIGLPDMYSAMQNHVVDGADVPLSAVEEYHVFEVQKYLNMTNQIWDAKWMIANKDAWTALPPDIQAAILRNAGTYALLERRDYALRDPALRDKFSRIGMVITTPDPAGFRAKLGAYYATWKTTFGPTAWGLLEQSVGKLT
jgi:tripartite ATP-independent transporter DctP family solute receptor